MDFIAMKRSQLYGLANNPYSSPQQPGGTPYPPSQPYNSPPPHRYPMTMQGRSQMAMGGMQYTQQQVAPYGQQGMGGYNQPQQTGQQGPPTYFSPPQQTPQGPAQGAYLQPRPPPQQQVQNQRRQISDQRSTDRAISALLSWPALTRDHGRRAARPHSDPRSGSCFSRQSNSYEHSPPYTPSKHVRCDQVQSCYITSREERTHWCPIGHEAQQDTYGARGPAPGNSGKANLEDGVSHDRPSSLPLAFVLKGSEAAATMHHALSHTSPPTPTEEHMHVAEIWTSLAEWKGGLRGQGKTSVMERNIAARHLNRELLPETYKWRPESFFRRPSAGEKAETAKQRLEQKSALLLSLCTQGSGGVLAIADPYRWVSQNNHFHIARGLFARSAE
ncbi:unnamed protein product [Tetraodon nigroviridis]|uniref:(spotted green pufferfish) hypothetical protein n=1 Tax=Tetraodon nigroviridis TaxID=99883 RepID=Q4RLK2_TETNG|nr:unnamed protein product [Tetraodon nigroviridis]